MTDPDDKALNEFLAGDRALSARYRQASNETSPPALDARILHAAHRELRARRRRWTLPLAMAAAVVLSVSVLLRLPLDRTTPMLTAPAATAKAMEAATPNAPTLDADDNTRSSHDAERANAADKKSAPAFAAPRRQREAPSSLSQHNAATPAVGADTRALDAPATSGAAAATEDEATAPRLELQAPPPAMKAQQHSAASARAEASVGSVGAVGQAPRDEPLAPSASEAGGAAPPAAPLSAAPLPLPQWLARIRALRAHGEQAAAAAELRALKARYPDYELPPDLRQ